MTRRDLHMLAIGFALSLAIGLAAIGIGIGDTFDPPGNRSVTCYDPAYVGTEAPLTGQWRTLDSAQCTERQCVMVKDDYSTTYRIPEGIACTVAREDDDA